MNRHQTKTTLRRQGLAPKKKLGQNFLVHEQTAARIVELAGVGRGETVVEVGVGLGALTRPLAAAAGEVIGIEADSGIVRMHRQQNDLPANVRLIHQDILRTDFSELAGETGGHLTIVANLPYSISSPFLFRLYEQAALMNRAVIMLQREVAERLLAKPGTKEYGVPTVLLASCSRCRILMRLGPEQFHPRPRVDSAVVELQFLAPGHPDRLLDRVDPALLRRVVNAAFGQRRKTLVNGLAGGGIIKDRQLLGQLIRAAGLDPGIRAERLRIDQFTHLTATLAQAPALSGKKTDFPSHRP